MKIKFTPAIEDPEVQERIITDIDTDGNAVEKNSESTTVSFRGDL